MHKAISRTLWGVAFVGGLTVLGAGAANAADTSGEDGVASGTQIGILGEAPAVISGNAISILGDSGSAGTVSQPAGSGGAAESASTTNGQGGTLGGSQVMPEVTAPVAVIGNAISILGDSSSADSATPNGQVDDTDASTGASAVTTGDGGLAGGNQVAPDAALPIVVGGNSISVLGDSTTEGTPTGIATADGSSDGTPGTTTGDDGIASGNQVTPDVDAPVVISGNDIAVIRDDGLGEAVGDDGVLDGILDGLLQIDPVVGEELPGIPIIGESVIDGPLVGGAIVSEPVIDGPVVDGPLIGDVLSPADTVIVTGDPVVDDGESPGPVPLMVTAALSPAMMLAATGGEALPLIGGIALMLGVGLALITIRRVARAVS